MPPPPARARHPSTHTVTHTNPGACALPPTQTPSRRLPTLGVPPRPIFFRVCGPPGMRSPLFALAAAAAAAAALAAAPAAASPVVPKASGHVMADRNADAPDLSQVGHGERRRGGRGKERARVRPWGRARHCIWSVQRGRRLGVVRPSATPAGIPITEHAS